MTAEYRDHDIQMIERMSRVEGAVDAMHHKMDTIGEQLRDYHKETRAALLKHDEHRDGTNKELNIHAQRIAKTETRSKFWGWLALISGGLAGFFSPWGHGQ